MKIAQEKEEEEVVYAYRKRRRRFVGEDVHEAASFFDSRVSRREIEESC
jgi:hypothetical protein